MGDIAYNFFMPFTISTPLPKADLSYLRNMALVVRGKQGVDAGVYQIVDNNQVNNYTDNQDAFIPLNKLTKYYLIVVASNGNLANVKDILSISEYSKAFWTILISSDFTKQDIEVLDVGTFDGIVGASFADEAQAREFGNIDKQSAFYEPLSTNFAFNMITAFTTMLGNTSYWGNCQAAELYSDSQIKNLGLARQYFDDRVGFTLTSSIGNLLGGFFAGRKAIIEPYVIEELKNKLQESYVRYINLNQPTYTHKNAKLIENYLEVRVLKTYLENGSNPHAPLERYTINVDVDDTGNFVGKCAIVINEPKALWILETSLTED